MSATNTPELKGRQDSIRAKTWELILYPAVILGNNCFMLLMMIVSYYAAGIVGLGTVIVSFIITGSRILDGITDPIIGYIVDKTNGKFGKVRLFLIMGFVIMAVSTILIYFTGHQVPEAMRMVYFAALYVVYIIGYTFYGISAKAGSAILTKDPQQRPIFGAAQGIYLAIFAAGYSVILSNYLAPKYGGFGDPRLFQEFTVISILSAGICLTLGLVAIWPKDRIENFGDGKPVKIKFKDMWPILKGNRPLQMFIIAMATDKLSYQIQGNQAVNVMLFGIVIGNFALLGTMGAIVLIPNIIVILFGMRHALKFGTRKGLVLATWVALIATALLFLVLWLGDPTQISLNNWGFMTIAFVTLYILSTAVRMVPPAFIAPMVPDIVDYEAYRSGRFVPGIIASLYNFVDKIVSSLAQTIVGLLLALIGFKTAFPDVDTPYSESIFWMTMFLSYGVLILGWIATLISMKFYKLDKEKMQEIKVELEERRRKNLTAG
ncbi:MAG: Na+/melibiose symporter [Shouchella clausii]|jgi:Na+/melibiose symporter-like transporter